MIKRVSKLEKKNMIFGIGKRVIISLFAATVLTGSLSAPLLAQEAAPAGQAVVATVDGVSITEAELSFAAEDLAQDLNSIPPAERRAFLVSVLVDMKLMANAARTLELDQSEVFVRRKTYLEERALRRAYFTSFIEAEVNEQTVRAAYDEFVTTLETGEEIRARHILLATEEDALAVIEELNAGRPFEDVAREKSTGPSGPNGGDLGFFGPGQMVPEFEAVAFTLEVGQVSAPVQTQFGWHVIKVEEKRQAQPPAFEEVAAQLRQSMMVSAFEKRVEELKNNAVIEISDPDIAAAYGAGGN
jgi:peptidyl-prolyl cis-trans isomerase C